jgi:hypothetical protein
MDWQSLIQDGVILFVLVGSIYFLKNQISSMKRTMEVIEKRAAEYEKLSEAYKKFSDDAHDSIEKYKKLQEEIFEKEKQLIEIEKSEAIGKQSKEIAELKLEKLGLKLKLSQTIIEEQHLSAEIWQTFIRQVGAAAYKHTRRGVKLSELKNIINPDSPDYE